MNDQGTEREAFDRVFDKAYEEKAPDYASSVNIALVGKVSAGKSSLLNAILERGREDPIAEVGSRSGVTAKVIPYLLENNVLIIDCPGLDDLNTDTSEETKRFLGSIDLGIFVVTGSADTSQRDNFENLKSKAKNAVVVLNKVDEWDHLNDSALAEVVTQWKQALGVDVIYQTCTKGFDPAMRPGAPMDIRGVEELRDHLIGFLRREKKDILFTRHLKNKERYAAYIIAAALTAVATEAFVPGSAAYITATQVAAIEALNFLYTGALLGKVSVLGLLPSFVGESIGMNVFLWAKSFLPPTLILDAAAAAIAVGITFAMLAAVKWLLENGQALTEREELKKAFNFFKTFGPEFKDLSIADLKDRKALIALVGRLLKRAAASYSHG